MGGVYLVEGGSGTGKTTLGMQFLLDGVAKGETVLFVSLAQPLGTIERIVTSHGWSMDQIVVRGFTPKELMKGHRDRQDVFLPEEVELLDFTERVESLIGDLQPDRIVFDSLTMLQILATAPGRYRQELVALVEFLRDLSSTSILTLATDGQFEASDAEAASDGIIRLEEAGREYGGQRFRVKVAKLRASDFTGGWQDFDIEQGGLLVYPRLVQTERRETVAGREFESGVPELDHLVGGGLAAGTSCLIIGPSGTGKTSLATKYIHAAAERGQPSVIFLFEEVRDTFLNRAAALGMDLRPHVESGLVVAKQIDGFDVSPGMFSMMVRNVLDEGAAIIVIDSLTGYLQSMPGEGSLLSHVRDLIRYMSHAEALSILTVSQSGMVGEDVESPVDVSESADAALLLRYFETRGSLRKALSVIKKRYGHHHTDIREMTLSPRGLEVGAPTRAFSGILSGTPHFEGGLGELIAHRDESE